MNRIDEKFLQLKKLNKKALITFLTTGDPNIETSKEIIKKMELNGADIIELGIPFSDPMAEGPVIQAANERALKNNIRIKDVFNLVSEIRDDIKIPLLFMLYYNIVFKFGIEEFFCECKKVGIDGVIIPDLPFEERDEIISYANEYGVYVITMISPVSKERVLKIANDSKGFLYCVTSLGVTGVRNEFTTNFEEFLDPIKEVSDIPLALGFGIGTCDHVRNLKKYADALIIGSAIVRIIGENGENAPSKVAEYIKEIRSALDE